MRPCKSPNVDAPVQWWAGVLSLRDLAADLIGTTFGLTALLLIESAWGRPSIQRPAAAGTSLVLQIMHDMHTTLAYTPKDMQMFGQLSASNTGQHYANRDLPYIVLQGKQCRSALLGWLKLLIAMS